MRTTRLTTEAMLGPNSTAIDTQKKIVAGVAAGASVMGVKTLFCYIRDSVPGGLRAGVAVGL